MKKRIKYLFIFLCLLLTTYCYSANWGASFSITFTPVFIPLPVSTFTVSGYVKDTYGTPIKEVKTILKSATTEQITFTTANGYYEFFNVVLDTYTLTAIKSDWIFNPQEYKYEPLNSDKTNQNFTGSSDLKLIIPELPGLPEIKLPATGDIKTFQSDPLIRGAITPDTGEKAYIVFKSEQRGRFTLRIFTLVGELVYEETKESDHGSGYFAWFPENIATGTYLVHIEGPGMNKFNKIVILR